MEPGGEERGEGGLVAFARVSMGIAIVTVLLALPCWLGIPRERQRPRGSGLGTAIPKAGSPFQAKGSREDLPQGCLRAWKTRAEPWAHTFQRSNPSVPEQLQHSQSPAVGRAGNVPALRAGTLAWVDGRRLRRPLGSDPSFQPIPTGRKGQPGSHPTPCLFHACHKPLRLGFLPANPLGNAP